MTDQPGKHGHQHGPDGPDPIPGGYPTYGAATGGPTAGASVANGTTEDLPLDTFVTGDGFEVDSPYLFLPEGWWGAFAVFASATQISGTLDLAACHLNLMLEVWDGGSSIVSLSQHAFRNHTADTVASSGKVWTSSMLHAHNNISGSERYAVKMTFANGGATTGTALGGPLVVRLDEPEVSLPLIGY